MLRWLALAILCTVSIADAAQRDTALSVTIEPVHASARAIVFTVAFRNPLATVLSANAKFDATITDADGRVATVRMACADCIGSYVMSTDPIPVGGTRAWRAAIEQLPPGEYSLVVSGSVDRTPRLTAEPVMFVVRPDPTREEAYDRDVVAGVAACDARARWLASHAMTSSPAIRRELVAALVSSPPRGRACVADALLEMKRDELPSTLGAAVSEVCARGSCAHPEERMDYLLPQLAGAARDVALLDRISRSPDETLRAYAATELHEFPDDAAARARLQALRHDRSAAVRDRATLRLSESHGTRPVPPNPPPAPDIACDAVPNDVAGAIEAWRRCIAADDTRTMDERRRADSERHCAPRPLPALHRRMITAFARLARRADRAQRLAMLELRAHAHYEYCQFAEATALEWQIIEQYPYERAAARAGMFLLDMALTRRDDAAAEATAAKLMAIPSLRGFPEAADWSRIGGAVANRRVAAIEATGDFARAARAYLDVFSLFANEEALALARACFRAAGDFDVADELLVRLRSLHPASENLQQLERQAAFDRLRTADYARAAAALERAAVADDPAVLIRAAELRLALDEPEQAFGDIEVHAARRFLPGAYIDRFGGAPALQAVFEDLARELVRDGRIPLAMRTYERIATIGDREHAAAAALAAIALDLLPDCRAISRDGWCIDSDRRIAKRPSSARFDRLARASPASRWLAALVEAEIAPSDAAYDRVFAARVAPWSMVAAARRGDRRLAHGDPAAATRAFEECIALATSIGWSEHTDRCVERLRTVAPHSPLTLEEALPPYHPTPLRLIAASTGR